MSRAATFEMIQPIARMTSAPMTSGMALRKVARALDSDRKIASPQVLMGWVIMETPLLRVSGAPCSRGPGGSRERAAPPIAERTPVADDGLQQGCVPGTDTAGRITKAARLSPCRL